MGKSELLEGSVDYERPPSRREAMFARLRKLLDRRWPVVVFQILNGLYLLCLGAAFTANISAFTLVALVIVYLVLFGTAHWLLLDTSREIERRAEERALYSWRRKVAQADISATGKKFLLERIWETTELLAILVDSGQDTLIHDFQEQRGKKLLLINATLRNVCSSLQTIAAKEEQRLLDEIWFRATYMEVQDSGDAARLVYVGWCTPDGNPPRSMGKGTGQEGKTYRKGHGCAGIAWERGRAVIEDFQSLHEWVDNYDDQHSNYASMICVPVKKGHGDDRDSVIGVITIDTNLQGYFGKKGDRVMEERGASMVLPYGSYISLITVADKSVQALAHAIGSRGDVDSSTQVGTGAPITSAKQRTPSKGRSRPSRR